MPSKVVLLEEKLVSIINELGFELEYIEEVNENNELVLKVVIDESGSNISTEEREKVSKKIEDIVDSFMKDKKYVLEVSSAGLEKNLKNIKLFRKYIGNNASIKLFKKTKLLDNFEAKEFEAVIVSVNDETEEIELKIETGDVVKINFENVASAHTVFDFEEFFKEYKK